MHNMTGAVVTGSFVMAAVGAFYLLEGRREEYGRIFLKVGVIAGVISSIAHHLSHRRSGRQIRGAQPAGGDRRHGGTLQDRDRRAHRADGPAQRGDRPDRQSHRGQRRAELPDLRHHQGRGEGARSVSARSVAHGAAAALLRLPHHGWARNLVRAADACRCISALARAALHARAGRCGRCCSVFRCPTSPTPPAG